MCKISQQTNSVSLKRSSRYRFYVEITTRIGLSRCTRLDLADALVSTRPAPDQFRDAAKAYETSYDNVTDRNILFNKSNKRASCVVFGLMPTH
ncbi:hypothetical protein EVAR_94878_1 [Eumeta japonica]|uniref:Uncharacterized protein n=1 Tax=Eumeta variegata TaxID=151549 RepID=A0A4C1VAV4_EUMVA|nr:hypothetical protein EVAR_94878_1 [Eumeta japonica]